MEDTTQWTTAPSFSPEEDFDMLRDMHTEGGSEAEYLLDVYDLMSQSHDDDEDLDDTSGLNHSLCSANSTSSALDAVEESTKTAASPSASPSSDSPRDSLFDGEAGDEEPHSDPIFIPVDYSEARKNHWRRPGYHDHEINPWASEMGKHQCLIPQARHPSQDPALCEAYRELVGRNLRAPIPPPRAWAPARCTENPWSVCHFEAPLVRSASGPRPKPIPEPDQEEGRLWYPKWHHGCRPPPPHLHWPAGEREPHPPVKWARIPCDCWHCVTHRSPRRREVRVYQLNEIFSKYRYSNC
ncbi:hypothetical protein PG991_014790 [Apiospora marii]|uniref:Uncharacterized protein n=1 Tax=Apiospora marii TaxID=335849 RepID=A0ABR1R4J9_9PEZI